MRTPPPAARRRPRARALHVARATTAARATTIDRDVRGGRGACRLPRLLVTRGADARIPPYRSLLRAAWQQQARGVHTRTGAGQVVGVLGLVVRTWRCRAGTASQQAAIGVQQLEVRLEMDGSSVLMARLQDILYILKSWGVSLLTLLALFLLGTFLYAMYWWCTSAEFRAALRPMRGDTGLSPEAARAQAAQRKHKIETATPTQLRQLIIAEAPNLVQASNRVPVGSEDELEELRALASVIPNKKSD